MSISSDFDHLVSHQDFHTNPKLNLKTPLCISIIIQVISRKYRLMDNLMGASVG